MSQPSIDLMTDQEAGLQASNDDWQKLKDLGNTAFHAGRHHDAIRHYTQALQLVSNKEHEALLYSNRSAARCGLSQSIRSRPATMSEKHGGALLGDDPTQLALMGLKDAEKAQELMPKWHKGYSRKGLALFQLEKYPEAAAAYKMGLELDPDNKVLQEGLREVEAVLQGAKLSDTVSPAKEAAAAPAGADSAEQPEGSVAKRQRVMQAVTSDDCECILCMKLLYEPVTTPCGHTFCKPCLMRANDHRNRCPVCRTVLHVGHDLNVTITFANLLQKCFPEEYEARREEETATARGSADGASDSTFILPLFVMSVVLPGESMGLNIFEPRYRLMVRRAMEGNRRFGMAQVNASTGVVEDVVVAAEVVECNPQPDGRFELELVGRERVRILSSWEQDGYRVARVAGFADEAVEGADAQKQLEALSQEVDRVLMSAVQTASGMSARLQARMMAEINPKPPAQQYEAVSFWAARLLFRTGLLTSSRMDVLRGTSTKERLEVCRSALAVLGGRPCRFM